MNTMTLTDQFVCTGRGNWGAHWLSEVQASPFPDIDQMFLDCLPLFR